MKKKLLLCSLIILCVCFGFSQETGKLGFFFKAGSSSSIGLSFNLSDRVTLRPSFGFETVKIEIYDDLETDTRYRGDLGLFYHLLKKKQFTIYSGLEMGYANEKIDGTVCRGGGCTKTKGKINGYGGNAILGFQYNFNKHLAVFGEIAFGFWKEESEYESELLPPLKSTTWSLNRSGFGIILYL